MSEIRHRHRILEAIDQLRRRKARPDVNRICSFMFRRFSVSCGETKSDLQKLIDAEIVIKVDYKGNTSYRNAAKWAMLPNYKSKQELDSSNTSSILSSAVAELIVLEPDYLDIGVPALELEKHLLKKDSRRFTKKNLDNVLKREIDNGTLVKLENGNYFLGEHSNASKQNNSNLNSGQKSTNKSPLNPRPKTKKLKTNKPVEAPPSFDVVRAGDNSISEERKEEQKEKMDENGATSNSNTTNIENVGFRVGGRQKRAKVMFDPSDNNLPKVSRKRPPGRPPINTGVKNNFNRSSSNGSSSSSNSNNHSSNTPNISRTTGTIVNSSSLSISGSSNASPVKTFQGLIPSSSPSMPSVPTNLPANPGVCCLCRSYGIRVKGVPERLIVCVDCTTSKAHPSCIESKREGASRNKNGLWQCTNCKRCTICDESGKPGKVAVCCSCNEAYHYHCHTPALPLSLVDTDKWKCLKCSSSMISSSTSPTSSNILPTSVTVINNVNNNNSIENNIESSDFKENEDIKPPLLINNLMPEAHVTTSSIITSSNIIVNNNNCPSLSSTIVSSSSISSNCTANGANSSSSSSQPVVCIVSTVASSISTTNTTSTTTARTPTASTSITSSSTVSSRGSSEIDDMEDVKDIKPVVIINDIKENIQKTFTLPLNNNNNINNRLSTSVKQHLPTSCMQDPYEGYPVDESIPDASNWSPQEVFQYFVKYFDHEVAKVFKEQEIDGQSLLLMKRLDVLTGLHLKLGPALKIYGHVKKLQIRRSDPKLIWS